MPIVVDITVPDVNCNEVGYYTPLIVGTGVVYVSHNGDYGSKCKL